MSEKASMSKPKPTSMLVAIVLTAVIISGAWYAAGPSIFPPKTIVSEKTVTVEAGQVKPVAATIKIALIVSSAAQDKSWNQFAYDDLMALQKERKDVQVTVSENVPPADLERVAGDFAQRGYQIVFAHTLDYQEQVLSVAKRFPNTIFLVTGGYKVAPNVAGVNIHTHETSFIVGYMAGAMSKTGKVAYVAGFKYPTQVSPRNAYKAGIDKANAEFKKDVKLLEAWTGTWFDVAKGREAGDAMIDQGADFVYVTLSGPGIGGLEAAKRRNVLGAGTFIDMSYIGENVVTSVLWKIKKPTELIIDTYRAGKFQGQVYNFGLPQGGSELTPITEKVPKDIRDKVDALTKMLAAGSPIVPYMPFGEI